MSDRVPLYNSIAQLPNVTALVALIKRVQDREYGLPGMAMFYGYSGLGKSFSAAFAANFFQAYCVEVNDQWRAKFLCRTILRQMGIKPAYTCAEMIEQIAEQLARTGKPLIIDEADHLAKHGLIELTRAIHEASGMPVILIGEETLPQTVRQWERVDGRMLAWVRAQEATMRDLELMATIYCRDVKIDVALRAHILKATRGSHRKISVNLAAVRSFAMTRGLDEVSLSAWGNAGLFTGEAPAPQRGAA